MGSIIAAAKDMKTFAAAVGEKVGEFGTDMSKEIVKASKAIWNDLNAAGAYLSQLACEAMALFLDAIVKTVFSGMMTMLKFAVWSSGKLVAGALKRGFNVRTLEY